LANDFCPGDFVHIGSANKVSVDGIEQSTPNAISLEALSVPWATLFDVIRYNDIPNFSGKRSDLLPLRLQTELFGPAAECLSRLNNDKDVYYFV